jgi:hypothetical protein
MMEWVRDALAVFFGSRDWISPTGQVWLKFDGRWLSKVGELCVHVPSEYSTPCISSLSAWNALYESKVWNDWRNTYPHLKELEVFVFKTRTGFDIEVQHNESVWLFEVWKESLSESFLPKYSLEY